jgi:hypothetical protein
MQANIGLQLSLFGVPSGAADNGGGEPIYENQRGSDFGPIKLLFIVGAVISIGGLYLLSSNKAIAGSLFARHLEILDRGDRGRLSATETL